jgi:hypothetical protein
MLLARLAVVIAGVVAAEMIALVVLGRFVGNGTGREALALGIGIIAFGVGFLWVRRVTRDLGDGESSWRYRDR